jgi:hypothetical protein
MRDSFVFYSSFAAAANMLGDKARLKLYDAVVKLGLCCAENVTELEQTCAEIESKLVQNRNAFAQFLLIKPQIIANFTRYINGSKGSKYGALGGAPVGNKNAAKNNPKTTPNVNENVNVNENIKENKKEKTKIFQKPTFEEVEAYCKERGNGVDVARWFDYYTANGWKVGKNPMKDWRAAVRTWERSEFAAPDNREAGSYEPTPEQLAEKQLMLEAIRRTEELQKKRIEARYGSLD